MADNFSVIPQDDMPFGDLIVHEAFTSYRGQFRVFLTTDRHTRCDRHGTIYVEKDEQG